MVPFLYINIYIGLPKYIYIYIYIYSISNGRSTNHGDNKRL